MPQQPLNSMPEKNVVSTPVRDRRSVRNSQVSDTSMTFFLPRSPDMLLTDKVPNPPGSTHDEEPDFLP